MHGGDDRPGVRVPVGLIGMIALAGVIELVVAARVPEVNENPVMFQWRATGRAARGDEVRRSSVLFFGDSLVKQGVYPRVVEARLGRPVYNLAVTGGTPPASFFLLRRALDAGARPEAVVVDIHARSLLMRPELTADYWPELVTTRELFELTLTARDARLFARVALAKALTSVRDRYAIRSGIMAALGGRPWPGDDLDPVFLRNCRVNRGVLVSPLPKSPALAGPAPVPQSAWWEVDRTATAFVAGFFDLAARRGIPVFWLLPPTSPAYQDDCERCGRDARYAAFVHATQARYPNVVVIDGRRSGYHRDLFSDATHLGRTGASAFSDSVATLLAAHLTGPGPRPADRWVHLPAYRARPEGVPLEDLDGSAVALKAAADRARR